MKLTKQKLLQITRDRLIECGYLEIENTFFGADGLFIKRVSDEFFLTLGLIISRYYDSKFTASYYLSKTTRWGSIWGDIPKESYKRVGYFLNNQERKALLDEEYNKEGVRDAWWDVNDIRSINNFISTVSISEQRFLEQPDLFKKIEDSLEVNILVEYVHLVNDIITSRSIEEFNYKFTPAKSINNIPIDWFKAAEIAITEKGGILNANTVKLVAADAWYQHLVKQVVQVSD